MESLKIRANAKINLALAVKYKREDGYHEIELIYQEIDFHDNLILSKNDGNHFSTDSPILQKESTNLCLTAANLLKDEFNIPGLDIRLEKRLPIGSGLGGGSSDAAAVLKGGLDLYGIKYTPKSLQSVAEKIGSDVPFFLVGCTAYGSGRGEIVKSIKIKPDYHILIIIPDIQISTKWAYKNLNLTLTKKNDEYKFRGFTFQDLDLVNFRSEFYNDFENLVFKHYRQLASVKSELYELGAEYASLSGSGSTLYGLFSSQSETEKAREILTRRFNTHISRPVLKCDNIG
jgi:4-diphosphocytidyl-2-C-methyl-D-erythritol kinase